jgi:photosystem II stability/assembly factor-like uncharacterized protein
MSHRRDSRPRRRGLRRRAGLALAATLWAGPAPAAGPAAPEAWSIPEADLYGVASDGEHVWAVGYWGTVLRSSDGGRSWERAATSVRETLYDVAFADARSGWAVGENGVVLATRDGGASWSRQLVASVDGSGAARPLDLHLFSVAAVSAREAWAVGDLGVVARTRDGERWETVTIPPEAFADAETPERILNGVDFADAERGWIVGEFGTVLRTTDGGGTWHGERRFLDAAPDLYLFDVSALDARRVAVTGLAGTVLVSDDGGETFERRATGIAAALYGISWRNPHGVAVGDRGEIRTSLDFGRSWRSPERPPHFAWLQGIEQGDGDGAHLYAVGEKGVVLRSDDRGASWRQLRGTPAPPRLAPETPGP